MIRSKYVSAVTSDTLPDANSREKREFNKSPGMIVAAEKNPMNKASRYKIKRFYLVKFIVLRAEYLIKKFSTLVIRLNVVRASSRHQVPWSQININLLVNKIEKISSFWSIHIFYEL